MAESNKLDFILPIASWIVRLEWLILLFITPLLLFPSPIRSLALLVILIIWTSRKIATSLFFDRTLLDWPILLLTVMLLVSLYATYDIQQSLSKITGLLLGVAIFYGVVHHGRQLKPWFVALGVFCVAGAGVAGLGLIGTHWSDKFPVLVEVTSRLPGVNFALPGAEGGFEPNEVAGALLWVAPTTLILAYLALRNARRLRYTLRPIWGVLILILSLMLAILVNSVLILTQSRSGLIAFVVVLLAMLLVVSRDIALIRKRPLWQLLVAGTILLAVAILAIQSVGLERVTVVVFGADEVGEGALSLNTLAGRVEVWSRAIYGIQDFPFTGMGMNTFRRIVHVLYPLFLISPDFDIAHAHNHLLQAALDLGIPGLIAYLGLWIGAAAMLWEVWRSSVSTVNRALVTGLGGGLLGHFLYGLTDAVALGAKPGILWWLLLGLITSLYPQVNKRRKLGTVLRDEEWLEAIFGTYKVTSHQSSANSNQQLAISYQMIADCFETFYLQFLILE